MCPSLAEPHASGFPRISSERFTWNMLLGKTIFNIRQKGVPPLLLPASLLQLPRCLTRTYNLTSYDTTLFELDSFKKCNCSMKNISANTICFANVGCSPTPRQHFWKIVGSKNFHLPAARFFERSISAKAMFHMKQIKNCFWRKRSETSGKRGFHPCFCLPACCNCPVALLELTTLLLMIQLCLNWTVSKNAIAARKTYLQI